LKEKFPQLASIIDRDLDENFNDKNNPLYSASPSRVRERVTRFHQRLLKQYRETQIMVVTHGGWLSLELHMNTFPNGHIATQIYESEDDVVSSSLTKYNMTKIGICFLLFAHLFFIFKLRV
jgi:broad specificity phosphatase PhoE